MLAENGKSLNFCLFFKTNFALFDVFGWNKAKFELT
jgi:hypothetical protein